MVVLCPIEGEVVINCLINKRGGGGLRESRSQSERYTSYP